MAGVCTQMLLSVLALCGAVLFGSNAHSTGFPHTHTPSGAIKIDPHFSHMQQSRQDGQCVSVVRRTVVGTQTVTYPCFRPIPGVVPQLARQRATSEKEDNSTTPVKNGTEQPSDTTLAKSLSPMGLICQGVVRVPKTQFLRIPTCCPGWRRSPSGACVKRNEGQLIIQKSLQPKLATPQPDQLRMEMPQMPPRMTPKFPPQMMASQMQQHLSPLQTRMMMQPSNTPEPEMPRKSLDDLTPYPVSNRLNKIRMALALRKSPLARYGNSLAQWAPRAMYMREMQMKRRAGQMALKRALMIRNLNRQRMMSRRIPFSPAAMLSKMMFPKGLKLLQIIRTLRPKMKDMRTPSIIITKTLQTTPESSPKPFPEIPRKPEPDNKVPQSHGIMGNLPPPMFLQKLFPSLSVTPSQDDGAPTPIPDISASELRPNPNLDILGLPHLPKFPVEMPPIKVQPGPNSPLNNVLPTKSCFAEYVNMVKQCLKDAKVELPPDQNFLPGKSSYDQGGVCEKRQVITECIMSNIRPCSNIGEQVLVRRTLADTLAEINRDCQLHELDSIESRLVHGDIEPGPDAVQHKLEIFEPLSKPTPTETVITTKAPAETTTKATQAPQKEDKSQTTDDKNDKKESIIETVKAAKEKEALLQKHDIRVEELSHEYYLPLLIGTAIGMAAIMILLSALLCICCRRRIKKKIYIERQPEKPKLLEGIYTIGVPPPVYEVNGIPPISYEEAKGEKITGSPASLRRHNAENEAQEYADNTSRKGVVSDI